MEIRIYYEDTDCGGVVYYANYLKYFERARTEFIRERGLSLMDYMSEGTSFIVVRAEVDYKSPGRYNDVITITTSVSEVSGASFTMEYTVLRKEDGKLLASGMTRLASINKEGKPTRLPKNLMETLSNGIT
ncbi:MAG: YbgC/FadM family acyl-CoA thioesterase [Thermodesulfobacteriota bacterium]|nr:YbgC/FadM family acyl-CoA thioesterase [Thermodesulfobacteriota bacterium]